MPVMYVINDELSINLDLVKAIILDKKQKVIAFNGLENLKEMINFKTEEATQTEYDNIMNALALNKMPKPSLSSKIKIVKGGKNGEYQ